MKVLIQIKEGLHMKKKISPVFLIAVCAVLVIVFTFLFLFVRKYTPSKEHEDLKTYSDLTD